MANSQAQKLDNVSEVIRGRFARSGSTNRSANGESTLRRFCEQGYTLAIYMYGKKPERTPPNFCDLMSNGKTRGN